MLGITVEQAKSWAQQEVSFRSNQDSEEFKNRKTAGNEIIIKLGRKTRKKNYCN